MDCLTVSFEKERLGVLTYNKHLNCRVLRMRFGNSKITLQIFVATNKVMCFSSDMLNFSHAFYVLYKKYGIEVISRKLCTSVWCFRLLSQILNMSNFYDHCLLANPHLLYSFEPELFPCISISNFANCSVVMRVFKTGKVIILGVRHVREIVEPLAMLSSMFFDYSLSVDFNNI